jgi:hypothetical protein
MTTSQQSHHSHNDHLQNEIIYLSTLSGYQTFGMMLALIRTRCGKSQQEIAEASQPYLRSRKLSLDRRMYGRLENDERYFAFAELEPLFRTFVEVFFVQFSEAEVELYVLLARKRLEQKRKKKERIANDQWDRLSETLASINKSPRSRIRLVEPPAAIETTDHNSDTESLSSRRWQALRDLLRTDTSHLLERQDWLQEMYSYVEMTPAKKIVVIQGPMGVGKSHALTLLGQHLAEQEKFYLIPYRFEHSANTTPDDLLAVFVATILADLLHVSTDQIKQRPVASCDQNTERTWSPNYSLDRRCARDLSNCDNLVPCMGTVFSNLCERAP